MEMLANLADGFGTALSLQNLSLALLGTFLGTMMGALPGLGPANGVAILIPLAFTLGLGATPALILLTCALLAPAHADAQALRPVAQPSAQEDAEILAREPRSANPYLAFLPAGVVPDYEWWNAKLRAESRRRQAEQART